MTETDPMVQVRPYEPRPKGTCPECGDRWTVRYDGTIASHAGSGRYGVQGPWNCPGSGELPTEGTLARCQQCEGLYLREDDGHRFCSERCVLRAEQARQQGSNDGQSDTSLADGPSTLPEPTIGADGVPRG